MVVSPIGSLIYNRVFIYIFLKEKLNTNLKLKKYFFYFHLK
jgi:nicotinamide riboside transporter PnuC